MRDSNQNFTCCRNNRAIVGWIAFLLLLSPLSVQMASGQVSLTITILINGIADDPVVPAIAEEPPAPPTEIPAVEAPLPSDVSASPEVSVVEPAVVESTAVAIQEPVTIVSAPEQVIESEKSNEKSATAVAEVVSLSENGLQPQSVQTPASPPQEQQLSVGPVKSLLPDDRPNWITLEPDYSTETHRFVVSSIPTARENDVDDNLDAPLEEALQNYVAEQLGDERAGSLLSNRLSAAFIRTNLVDDKLSYTAELTTTSGGMFQKWVMVEVTQEQREQLQTWYREQVQRQRIVPLGLGVVGLLSVVGFLNLVLRKSAGKTPMQPLQAIGIGNVVQKRSCCSKKGSWGFAVAIAIAIAVAIFAG